MVVHNRNYKCLMPALREKVGATKNVRSAYEYAGSGCFPNFVNFGIDEIAPQSQPIRMSTQTNIDTRPEPQDTTSAANALAFPDPKHGPPTRSHWPPLPAHSRRIQPFLKAQTDPRFVVGGMTEVRSQPDHGER